MKQFLLALALILTGIAPVQAELVVVVSHHSPVTRLSRDEVIGIFLGRDQQWPDGSVIIPLDLGVSSPERQDFYERLIGKSLPEVNAYWTRLVFAGKTAPQALASQQDVVRYLALHPNAIGYVDRYQIDSNVRIVYSLPLDVLPFF